MPVPLLDLKRQYARIREDVAERLGAVLDSQQFILGAAVEEFEAAAADFAGAHHAVGMSSGTDALLAILMAMDIGPRDAVVTTPYTFFATVGCIHRLGAEPVFVDIDPETYNLSPERFAECVNGRLVRDGDGFFRTRLGNRVRAVIPIHLFGQCCEMDAIVRASREHGMSVIEDAAQAIGAEYPSEEGTKAAGAIAEWGYFSFFPAKNLGAFGDGGLATCRRESDAGKLRLLRNHGMERRYYHRHVGGNFRLDALQAAVLHAKLAHLPTWNAERRANARKYVAAFEAAGLDEIVSTPSTPFADRVTEYHIFHQFVIRAPRRDALLAHLSDRGIGHGVYYPVPLHLQECFAHLAHKPGEFPESERAAAETVALPIFPELEEAEIAEVVDTIKDFYRR